MLVVDKIAALDNFAVLAREQTVGFHKGQSLFYRCLPVELGMVLGPPVSFEYYGVQHSAEPLQFYLEAVKSGPNFA